MISCLLIISTICFHGATSVTLNDLGLSANAGAIVNDVRVDIVTRSDQILFLDWRKLPGACAETFCIAYFKRCKESAASFTCEYHYAFLGDAVDRVVKLIGKGPQQIHSAESNISIISPLGILTNEIPLVSLTKDNALAAPPYCRAGGPLADCWPNAGH